MPDAPDESDESTPEIMLRTEQMFSLEQRRMEDDEELAPGAAIAGTYLNGKLIARSVADPEWTPEMTAPLFEGGVPIVYVATVDPAKGIDATLYASIPPSRLPREPWEAEPPDEPEAVLLLGKVVRLAVDLTSPDDPVAECVDHLSAIIGGGAVSVVDKLLGGL